MRAGEVDAAKRAADGIEDAEEKGWAYRRIAAAQATAGDGDGAARTVDAIGEKLPQTYAHLDLAAARAKAGDAAGVKASLAAAHAAADAIANKQSKASTLCDLAGAGALGRRGRRQTHGRGD